MRTREEEKNVEGRTRHSFIHLQNAHCTTTTTTAAFVAEADPKDDEIEKRV